MIKRIKGNYAGRNKSSAYKDLVWTVATASNTSLGIEGQTELTLKTIEENLEELGSSKNNIVSAQVYITNMQHKVRMDNIWKKWIGVNSDNWPQRACVAVGLEGDVLIEVSVTAVLV